MYKPKSKTRQTVDKVATRVNKITGATNLAKYIGEGMAKRKNPAVQRTVSGKDALKSAGSLAMSIGTVTGIGGALKLATKAKVAKSYVHGASTGYIKRNLIGHEREGFRQAAKRNATKKKGK